ncbi:MAG: cache domain-containing protein [Jatrophihabitans sp.]|uniref:cache domain-containing protein n=1 Tax=Jatrophihabitans sp. TaxID=1932789 RepID=UPI003F7DA845
MMQPVAAEVGTVLDSLTAVFEDLEPLAEQYASLFTARQTSATDPVREDLVGQRPTIQDNLARPRGWLVGAGVVVAPHLLADAPRWLEWWWARDGGNPEALRVSLDESAADFFDYTSAEWYAVPAQTGRRHAAGPYVDYLCTNEYSVTLAAPVRVGGQLLGMVGGDVLAASIERRLMPVLRRLGPDTVLCNADGRVIASATARHAPGHRLAVDGGVPLSGRRRTAQGTESWRLLSV